MHRLVGVLGMITMMAVAYLFSTNRRAIRYKTVAWGLGLQIVFAFLVMRWQYGRLIFQKAGAAVNWVLDFAFYGSEFVFGNLGKKGAPMGFFFAFQVLPTIIFIAAVFALLYYYGVMQFIIRQAAKIMTRLMGASGAESLNVAASIFMGQTEAPLTIRPFIPEADPVRIDDDHDQRNGARFGRDHGGVHRLRNRGQTFAGGGDHDGAGDDFAVEDAGAGNGNAGDVREGRDGAAGARHERAGGDFARHD